MNIDKDYTLCQDILSLAKLCSHQIANPKLREEGIAKSTLVMEASLKEIQQQAVYFGIWWSTNKIDNLFADKNFSYVAKKNQLIKSDKIHLTYFRICTEINFLNLKSLSLDHFPINSELKFRLPQIKILHLCDCEMTEFPTEILNLNTLTSLDLSFNHLTVIPSEIEGMCQLKTLSLKNNLIDCLPCSFSKLDNLEMLNLSNNQIRQIPLTIFSMTHLKALFLETNEIHLLPDQICSLLNLNSLHLDNNHIKTIPDDITKLTNLLQFNLSGNSPFNYRPVIECLSLTYLHLDHSNISKIPAEIFECRKLKWLSLKKNNIKIIPVEILQLKKIVKLGISYNAISEIGILARLNVLEKLCARSNPIRWDDQILDAIEKGSLVIKGIESEICLSTTILPPTKSFPELIKQMSLLTQEIVTAPAKANLQVLLKGSVKLVVHFTPHFKNISFLALKYEQIQRLKIEKLEILFQFLFKNLCHFSDIILLLEFINLIFDLDNSILKSFQKIELYDFFSRFFKKVAAFYTIENPLNLFEPLKFLGAIERYFSFNTPINHGVYAIHPLSDLKEFCIDTNSFYYMVKILNFSTDANSMHYNLNSILKNLALAFNTHVESGNPNIGLLQNPYLFKFIKIKFSSILKNESVKKEQNNLLAIANLNTVECYDKNLDPWFHEILLEFLTCGLYTELDKNIDIQRFHFLYQQCFLNAHFISKKNIAPLLLKFFCTNLDETANRKKSLEAIALLLMTSPNLEILEGWIPENILKDYAYPLLLRQPLAGEKLAWCGALKLLNVPGIGKDFINTILVHPSKVRQGITTQNFRDFWHGIVESKDPFIALHVEELLCQPEAFWLKLNAKKIKKNKPVDSEIHQHELFISINPNLRQSSANSCREINKILKRHIKTNVDLEIFENEIQSLKAHKRLMQKSIIDIQKNSMEGLRNDFIKIDTLLKHLQVNESDHYMNVVNSMMENSFLPIEQKKSKLKSNFEEEINLNKKLISNLLFSIVSSDTKIKQKNDNEKLIITCDSIFTAIIMELDIIDKTVRANAHLTAIDFYNRHSVWHFDDWMSNFKTKIALEKLLDTSFGEFAANIPKLQAENIQELLENFSLIDDYKFSHYSELIEKRFKNNLYGFSKEQLQLEQSKKEEYLHSKVKKLENDVHDLKMKNAILQKKMHDIPVKFPEQKDEQKKMVYQIAQRIENNIKNLKRFQVLPPPPHWDESWLNAWKSVIKHLDEIQNNFGMGNCIRNCKRIDMHGFLRLAGFEAKRGELDGSHLEVKHLLFNLHTSLSFSPQKALAIQLVKEYYELVDQILGRWCVEIINLK